MSTSPFSGKVYGTPTPGRPTLASGTFVKPGGSASPTTLTQGQQVAGGTALFNPQTGARLVAGETIDPMTGRVISGRPGGLSMGVAATDAMGTSMQGSQPPGQLSPTTAGAQAPSGLPGGLGGLAQPSAPRTIYGTQVPPQEGETLSRFAQALPQLQAGGAPGGDAGVAKAQAAGALQQPKAESNVMAIVQETEPGFVSSIQEYIDDYFSPENRRKSYVEEYKSMAKELGLQGINEKMLNIDKIIEGTEDDIRAEVTAAGGFATDSQVLALANARNKQNIKEYNTLAETRKFAMQQLDTMMQLSMEDRRSAEREFDMKIGWAFKQADFIQTAQRNAVSQFQWLAGQSGGLEAIQSMSSDPYYNNLINKVLGGVGGLQGMVKMQQDARAKEEADRLLDRRIKLAQAQKLEQDTDGTGGGKPISPATALQLADSQAATQMLSELRQVINKNGSIFGPVRGRIASFNPYDTRAQDVQSTINATKQIVGKFLEGGVLRKEDEAKYEKILPTLKDTPAVASAKLNNVINLVNLKMQAQQSTLQTSGYNVNLPTSGSNIVIGPDGQEYEITN